MRLCVTSTRPQGRAEPVRSVTRRRTFDAFRGRSVGRFGGRGAPVRVTYLASLDGESIDDAEVAFAIDRRFGTAVERNRSRRRIRAALADVDAERSLPHGAYLFRPSRGSLHCSYATLVSSVGEIVDQIRDGADTVTLPENSA